MAELPTPQVLVDWRRSGMNRVLNGGFETDTSGWSVGAGINAAGTSITRTAAAAFVRSWGARIVCSGANSSGANYVMAGNFAANRTYRFRIPAKRVSGTTAARMTIGSLGTPADRATATFVLTDDYGNGLFSVDWTPSATRGDAQIAVMANAAAALTFDIDHVEVYEAINDITDDCMTEDGGLGWERGASFDGSSESPGTATLTVLNVEGKYNKRNAASTLYGLIKPKRRICIRTTFVPSGYANGDEVVRGAFYGVIKNIVPKPGTDLAEVLCQDMLYVLRKTPFNSSGADNLSYGAYRQQVLAAAGITAYSIPPGEEDSKFYSFSSRRSALAVLADVNAATGSIHVIEPAADLDLLYRYTVRDRSDLIDGSAGGISEHFDGTLNNSLMWIRDYDDSDETVQNVKRVQPHQIEQRGAFDLYYRKQAVPIVVPNGETVDFYADFSKDRQRYKPATVDADQQGEFPFPNGSGFYVSGPTVYINGSLAAVTGARAIEVDYFPQAVYFQVTATGGPFTITSAEIYATKAVEVEDGGGFRMSRNDTSIAEFDVSRGPDIDSPYVPNGKRAKALAKYWTDRYNIPRARANLVVQNRFPSQLARQVGQRVNVSEASDEITLSQIPFVIRSLQTSVKDGGTLWETTYEIEEIPDTTPSRFIIGTSLIGGSDVIL